MNKFSRNFIVPTILLLWIGLALSIIPLPSVNSQVKPLTIINILTGLSSTKLPPGVKSKAHYIDLLIIDIKKRGVDEPLTPDYEKLLRKAGATDQLIETIRLNWRDITATPSPSPSPKTDTPTPITPTPATPTPTNTTATVTVSPTPTITSIPISTTPSTPIPFKMVSNALGMEFVLIPAGTFLMGSPPSEQGRNQDEIQHRVTITRDFFIARHEITQGQWKAVMENNPSYYSTCGDNCPVESVSWNEVQEFIAKLNTKGMGTYRLPTEAEWEYAARGGKESEPFGIGDGKNLSSDLANFLGDYPYGEGLKGNTINKTTPVGFYPPNYWGLYDMHGNVREWCADWYAEYVNSLQKDPKGPVVGTDRVYRGGGFQTTGGFTRSAVRYNAAPSVRRSNVGFRLVKVD